MSSCFLIIAPPRVGEGVGGEVNTRDENPYFNGIGVPAHREKTAPIREIGAVQTLGSGTGD
jgi:hypothetical protein